MCLDGFELIKNSSINISFSKKCTDKEILEDAFKQMGLDKNTIPSKPNGKTWQYNDNYSKSGSLTEILEPICKKYDMNFSIENNETVTFSSNNNETIANIFVINESTGMIDSPERVKSSKPINQDTTQDKTNKQPQSEYGFRVSVKFNPSLSVNNFINIESIFYPQAVTQRIKSMSLVGVNNSNGEFLCRLDTVDV
jgi:hypothetical protein